MQETPRTHVLTPIGVLRSCFTQKFGIPRQPGLVPSATATLLLDRRVVTRDALRGMEAWSHAWVVFIFHEAHDVKQTVRPPRLGGRTRVGVLATRSPHRPNHLGLSAVELGAIDLDALTVELRGGDFLDGTPVVDLKPYVPYADSLPHARQAWADPIGSRCPVRFLPEVEQVCRARERDGMPGLVDTIVETLANDPRRAGARDGTYFVRLGTLDVLARREGEGWVVERIDDLEETNR
jgi:tRNA-Thr(GGU) m(6)t(6)A37 methyltransferase TsaA